MRILIDINHPADVHQFKNFIKKLEKNRHEVLVTARDKDHTHELLNNEKIKFIPRKGYHGIFGKFFGVLLIGSFLLKQTKNFKPDLLIGSSGNCYIAQVSKLLKKPSLIFDDTEHSKLQNLLTFPFATKIVTPSCYLLHLGKKQIKYNGFKELAYLSPKYFRPNKSVLKKYRIKGKFFVLRLVAWDASHDISRKGINFDDIIKELEKRGRIIITSERKLPKTFDKYLIEDPSDLHSLLYYSDLFIGEGASTAAEAALLGTPSIYTNEFKLGYINELIKYGLVTQITDEKEALEKSLDLIKKGVKHKWKVRKERIMVGKGDLNDWMLNLTLNYNTK